MDSESVGNSHIFTEPKTPSRWKKIDIYGLYNERTGGLLAKGPTSESLSKLKRNLTLRPLHSKDIFVIKLLKGKGEQG